MTEKVEPKSHKSMKEAYLLTSKYVELGIRYVIDNIEIEYCQQPNLL